MRRVHFVDPAPYRPDTLAALVNTRATHCRLLGLPICIPGTGIGRQEYFLDLRILAEDADRLALFYRQSGFFNTTVGPVVEPVGEEDGLSPVEVGFLIERGVEVVLRSVEIEGVDELLDTATLARALPSRPGQRFHVGRFIASADTLVRELRQRGHAYAEVLRNYTVNLASASAEAHFVAIPGPVVRVDSIVVEGAENLGRAEVLRQVRVAPGDLLRATDLLDSQRNLFSLDLVQFAGVSVAPDTVQQAPTDSARATVLVQVVEGPVHVVDAAIGYGSVSCFQTDGRWVSRSLFGGARRLSISAQVSKIGVAEPAFGFARDLCPAFAEDEEFGEELDYQVATEFTRPYFVSPRNHLAISIFAERVSEPDIFQREARGGRLTLARRFADNDLITLATTVRRGRTRASPAIFCAALLVCEPGDIAVLQESRWRNAFEGSFLRDRADRPISPTGGYQARTIVTWATPVLGSEVVFLRTSGDGSAYHQLSPGWILAGRLRLGQFFGPRGLAVQGAAPDPTTILAADERFYAGGPNSVRGYAQNALGPGVYVANAVEEGDTLRPAGEPVFVPSGGTGVATASLELRMPSLLLPELLRWAVFLDGGAVAERAVLDAPSQWRFTPGVGLRLQTPVGPIRLDAAYNPYGRPVGDLYLIRADDSLVRHREDHAPSASFLQRIQLHLAVGHPF